MTKQELIDLLNADLSNEYKHMLTYLHFASTVEGLHREELSEFWMKAAQSEMQHVAEFSKMIVGLGGMPVRGVRCEVRHTESVFYCVEPFPYLTDPLEQVKYALAMEDEVVANYVQRLADAEKLGGVDGTFVGLFLEDQIVDSRTDADHLRQMLKQKRCY